MKPNEGDKIQRIIRLKREIENESIYRWHNILATWMVIFIAAGLAFQAFGNVWAAALFGLIVATINSVRTSIVSRILEVEFSRSVDEYDGDLERLQSQIELRSKLTK